MAIKQNRGKIIKSETIKPSPDEWNIKRGEESEI